MRRGNQRVIPQEVILDSCRMFGLVVSTCKLNRFLWCLSFLCLCWPLCSASGAGEPMLLAAQGLSTLSAYVTSAAPILSCPLSQREIKSW